MTTVRAGTLMTVKEVGMPWGLGEPSSPMLQKAAMQER